MTGLGRVADQSKQLLVVTHNVAFELLIGLLHASHLHVKPRHSSLEKVYEYYLIFWSFGTSGNDSVEMCGLVYGGMNVKQWAYSRMRRS